MGWVVDEPAKAGAELRATRERLGMSQAEFGRRLGVSQSQVSALERGVRGPSLRVYLRIVAAQAVPEQSLAEELNEAARAQLVGLRQATRAVNPDAAFKARQKLLAEASKPEKVLRRRDR